MFWHCAVIYWFFLFVWGRGAVSYLHTMLVPCWYGMTLSIALNRLCLVLLGNTKYQVSILGSGMVVSNTEISIVRYQILPHGHVAWKYLRIPSTSVASEHLVFLSWKLICKRRTCLKPNITLLSLNKDLLMSRLGFQKGVEVLVSANTRPKILCIGIEIKNVVSPT